MAPNTDDCFDNTKRFSFIHASRADGTFMWIKFFPFDYSSNQAYYDLGYYKFDNPVVMFPKPSTWDSSGTSDPPKPSGYLLVKFDSWLPTIVLMNVADGSFISTQTIGYVSKIIF